MWVFEKRGFVSVVAYDPTKDGFNKEHMALAENSDDPKGGWLLIRARAKEDLVQVEQISGVDIHITTDPVADYSFRGLMTRQDYKDYLSKCVDDIDYGSHFKEVCRDNSSQGQVRHGAMMSVWSAMLRLQPYAPYGGHGNWDSYSGGGWKAGNWTSGKGKKGKAKKGIGGMSSEVDTWKGKDYYDGIFGASDAEDEDWYNWRPEDDGSKVTSVTVTKSTTTSYVGSAGNKTVPDFQPSTYWYEPSDLAKAFLNGMVLNDFSNDDIESMRDDTMEMWFEALARHGEDEILSATDIEALCGEEIYTQITNSATVTVAADTE